MKSARLFGVYTAELPFIESEDTKIRPVVVISHPHSEYNMVVVIPISSRLKCETVDFQFQDWLQVGLLKPSVARVHRITTMLQADLKTELGVLSGSDTQKLKAALSKLLLLR